MRARLDYNPYSFLHILNPGYKFQHTISGTQKFQLIKNRYLEFKEEDTFIQDENPCFYVYKMVTRDLYCCGIIAAASAEDYKNNIIRKHEETIAKREELFKEYVKTVGFNTEPVLLTYESALTARSMKLIACLFTSSSSVRIRSIDKAPSSSMVCPPLPSALE